MTTESEPETIFAAGPDLGLPRRGPLKRLAHKGLSYLPAGTRRAAVAFYRRWVVGPWIPALTNASYRRWARRYDTPAPASLAAFRSTGDPAPARPLLSIVMPVYNPAEKWLRAAIDSVLAQSCPDWQLIVSDDCSSLPHVAPVLAEYAAGDRRITLVTRPRNGGISRATNAGIDAASGEFIGFLDHDDELAPHALYYCAAEIAQFPDCDVIYSDEDKIDTKGRRFHPCFKSDWNPDLFLSQNMISHFGVYRASLVRAAGGARPEFDGGQDYDLALRVIERSKPERIRHIPRILYHWRAVRTSTAHDTAAKPGAASAGIRAVEAHLARRGIEAKVLPAGKPGLRQVHYALTHEPLVSVIVPTRDRLDLLRVCIGGVLERTNYRHLEVLIVDNGSKEAATLAWLSEIAARDPRVRVLRYPGPFNYSAINNRAVAESNGKVLLLLNNDTDVIEPDWLRHMVANALRPEVGAVGAKLLYADGSVQHGGIILGIGGVAGHFHHGLPRREPGYFGRAMLQQNLSAVTAACLATRRGVFDQAGGLDERNLRVAFNDVDLCLRIRKAGYLVVWTPLAELYHDESASREADTAPDRIAEYRREGMFIRARWKEWIERDPYFNPNLALVPSPGLPASPPRLPPVDATWRQS